jgi:LCP family protein required for cell wall assembly
MFTLSNFTPPVKRREKPEEGGKFYKSKKKWYKIPLVIFAILFLSLGGLLAYKIIKTTGKVITENISGSAPALTGNVEPLKLKGEGDGRINILLLGIGGKGHDAPNLTDTIIVLSIDPKTKSVAVLSIPRDFYVSIPKYGYNRINSAYALGEEKGYQGGGAALTKEVVSNILDLPIHYYIRLDFAGFEKIVDTLGGITVEVEKDIHDFEYPDDKGGCSPFHINAGTWKMDGELALKYVRSRKTSSDFDRARRQQKVLVAIKNKAFQMETILNPQRIAAIIDTLGDHARTDLQLWEMERLIQITRDINTDNIACKVLDDSPKGLLYATRVDGIYVLKPRTSDYSEIRKLTHELFVDAYIKEEEAKIELLNGTSQAAIATSTKDLLQIYGYNIVKVGFAETRDFKNCIIYDYTGEKPYTVALLSKRFNAQIKRQFLGDKPEGIDIRIIIGEDYL